MSLLRCFIKYSFECLLSLKRVHIYEKKLEEKYKKRKKKKKQGYLRNKIFCCGNKNPLLENGSFLILIIEVEHFKCIYYILCIDYMNNYVKD